VPIEFLSRRRWCNGAHARAVWESQWLFKPVLGLGRRGWRHVQQDTVKGDERHSLSQQNCQVCHALLLHCVH